MPRVPQVFSPGQTGVTPGARLDPGAFAQATTGGLQAAAGEFGKATRQYQDIYATLRTENEKLEAERALGEVQRQFVDADIQLKQDPHVTPEQYPQEVERRLRTIREGVGKSLQYPGSRVMFERGVGRFFDEKVTAAKYEGLERMHAQVKATTSILVREDVREAVFGASPEAQEQAMRRGLDRVATLAGQRILSGGEANAMTAGILADVEEGRLRRDARNPELREGVIDGLLNGTYSQLDPVKQLAIADTLLRDAEAEQTKRDKAAAEAAETQRKVQLDQLYRMADEGTLTNERLTLAEDLRIAIGADARALRAAVRSGSAAGGRTDDEVYNRLELDLLENPRSHSAREVRRIQAEGKLAASGNRSAATLLKLIGDETAAASAKDISQKPLFKQGLHELRQSLRGGAGPLESLTREAATRLENAEREYHDLARSGKIGEEALPETARRIVERLRKQAPLDMGDPEVPTLLRYRTPKDLLDAKAAGIIPDAEFNRQFKLMQSLGLFNKPGATPTPAKTEGKPSGGR
jgi:hypothetical protein